MRLANAIVLTLPLLLGACAASRSSQKASDAASPSGGDAAKQQECAALIAKLDAVDQAVAQLSAGPEGGLQSLGPTFEQLSEEIGAMSITTPELDEAARSIAADADAFVRAFAAVAPDIDAIQEVMESLARWQTDVELAAKQFETTCASASAEECASVGVQLQNMPDIENDDFVRYADELEAFVAATREIPITDPSLAASVDALLTAIGEGVEPFRRLPVVLEALLKLEPESDAVQRKSNEIRELCGAAQ